MDPFGILSVWNRRMEKRAGPDSLSKIHATNRRSLSEDPASRRVIGKNPEAASATERKPAQPDAADRGRSVFGRGKEKIAEEDEDPYVQQEKKKRQRCVACSIKKNWPGFPKD